MTSDCKAMGTCPPETDAKSADFESRTEEEWRALYVEHGLMHFMEFMERANPLQGQLIFIIAPIFLGSWYYVLQYTMRKDLPGTTNNYWYNYAAAESRSNVWLDGWNIKVYISSSLMILGGIFELLNMFLFFKPEVVFGVWGIGFAVIVGFDILYYLMNMTGQKRMYQASMNTGST